MVIDKIENMYASFWNEDGIIIFERNGNNDLNLHGAKLCVAHSREVGRGIPSPTLVDITRIKFGDIESRQYFASAEALEHLTAIAIYVNSSLTAFIANTYLIFGRPTLPTKVFHDKTKAIAWLQQFKTTALN